MKAVRPEELGLSGLDVLIVDDNATNRLIVREMVSSWGLVPTEKEDGEQGFSELKRAFDSGSPYRLLLLDAQMPGGWFMRVSFFLVMVLCVVTSGWIVPGSSSGSGASIVDPRPDESEVTPPLYAVGGTLNRWSPIPGHISGYVSHI